MKLSSVHFIAAFSFLQKLTKLNFDITTVALKLFWPFVLCFVTGKPLERILRDDEKPPSRTADAHFFAFLERLVSAEIPHLVLAAVVGEQTNLKMTHL